jgi:outer membrane biosynthesis protein TonB
MKLTLLESQRGHWWMSEGAAYSLTAHVLLISAVVAVTRSSPVVEDEKVDERVQFLIPMDRVLGRAHERPQQQSVQWRKDSEGAGNEGLEQRKVEKKAEAVLDAAGKGPDEAPPATETTAPPVEDWTLGDTVMTVLEVDSAVARYPESAAPAYPAAMLAKSVEGSVNAQFIVDTLGFVDTLSFHVLSTTHPEFTRAVQNALPGMKFHPAILRSHKVRQLVQQSFSFKIVPQTPAETAAKGKKPGE